MTKDSEDIKKELQNDLCSSENFNFLKLCFIRQGEGENQQDRREAEQRQHIACQRARTQEIRNPDDHHAGD